jgi:hypothetical protein
VTPIEPSHINFPFYSAISTIKSYSKVSLALIAGIITMIIVASVTLALVHRKTQHIMIEETPTKSEVVHEKVQPEGVSMWPIILGVIGVILLAVVIISVILYKQGTCSSTSKVLPSEMGEESKTLDTVAPTKLDALKLSKKRVECGPMLQKLFGGVDQVELCVLKEESQKGIHFLRQYICLNCNLLFALAQIYKKDIPPLFKEDGTTRKEENETDTLSLYASLESTGLWVHKDNNLITGEIVGEGGYESRDLSFVYSFNDESELKKLYNDLNTVGGHLADVIIKCEASTKIPAVPSTTAT